MDAIESVKDFGFSPPKFYENPNSKLARSKSLNLLKPSKVTTMRMWKGVFRTKDVNPSKSKEEHNVRVMNRENTPWLTNDLPTSGKKKDDFVSKYWHLI